MLSHLFLCRRQDELESKLIEDETQKRVEELVAKRVAEELEKRKDEIEAEVLRRVEEAKKVGTTVKPTNSIVHKHCTVYYHAFLVVYGHYIILCLSISICVPVILLALRHCMLLSTNG